ncbi:MAG: hypothetical protein HY779_03440 [Rubrobacteridae bacterium]|nr:hypothetical protein [Rubrobacteridae bacterium]
MKRQKISIRVTPKKQRKTWQINPVERVHDDTEYSRSKSRDILKRMIEDELENEQ